MSCSCYLVLFFKLCATIKMYLEYYNSWLIHKPIVFIQMSVLCTNPGQIISPKINREIAIDSQTR